MRQLTTIAFFLVSFCSNSQSSNTGKIESKVSLESVYKHWENNQFALCYREGKLLRHSILSKYKKQNRNSEYSIAIPFLDFMLLSSMCQLTDTKEAACQKFHLIFRYGLSEQAVTELRDYFNDLCSNKQKKALPALTLSKLKSLPTAHVGGDFKSFAYTMGEKSALDIEKTINFNLPPIEDTIKLQKLLNRKISKSKIIDSSDIGFIAKGLENPIYHTTKNFIIITESGKEAPLQDLIEIGEDLEKVLEYYQKQYEFPADDKYINIYYTKRDIKFVSDMIEKIYDVSIFRSNPIGFSNPIDNSIFAFLPGDLGVGTLKHELMHLLLKKSFGSIPVWFEEGLASLYEESRFTSDGLKGIGNWRKNYLQAGYGNTNIRDILKDTVKAKPIDSHDPNALKKVNEKFHKDALQRYLFLFLQSKGLLKALFYAFKKREDELFDTTPLLTDEQIILQVFNCNSLVQVDRKFEEWLSINLE